MATQLDLFAELEHLRIAHDWTYRKLGDDIFTKTSRFRDQDCWRRICQGLVPQPHKRTLDIIETYLGLATTARPVRRPAKAVKAVAARRLRKAS